MCNELSLRTEDSLNCPCNGIYKCGLHSIPKFLPYPKINNPSELLRLVTEEYGERIENLRLPVEDALMCEEIFYKDELSLEESNS